MPSSSNIEARTESIRIPELDGIRGIAILMVLIWHYVTCVEKPMESGSLWYILHFPTKQFWTGVDLFFVLSGFLIGGIILENYRAGNFLRVFWIKRACRILPVYVCLLLVYAVASNLKGDEGCSWLFANPAPWWSYLLFVQNIWMGTEGTFGANFLGITWSVAVEEQFYLLAPLGLLLAGRKRFVAALLPLILVALLLRLLFPGFHSYVVTPFRMDALLMGVCVAVIYKTPEVWMRLCSHRALVSLCFLLSLVLTAVLMLRGGFGSLGIFWFAALYSGFLVFALANAGRVITSWLRTDLLCFFGSISYALYMYHQGISGLVHCAWGEKAEPNLLTARSVALTAIAASFSIIAAWVSLRVLELPFLKFGKRFRYQA